MQTLLSVLSGALVGFTLGLIGGGGSIIATPLLLYVVGLPPHVAIGTGAFAVAVNSFVNLTAHARAGNVRWRGAALFALVGVLGAAAGSNLGQRFDGNKLLFLFAILMVVIGILMLRRRTAPAPPGAAELPLTPAAAAAVSGTALLVGLLAGFFGIGGGFLIVPGLVFATGMPMVNAVGSSLLSVGSFGLTTAISYALAGLVDWPVAGLYIAGGIGGGLLGMRLCNRLSKRRAALTRVFAALVFAVAAYMLYRNASAFIPAR